MGDEDRSNLVEEALRALREADAELASLIAIHRQMLADAQRLSKLGTRLSDAIAHAEANVSRQLQELNTNYKLMQLQIGQNIDVESRRFTLLANIMKTKHDTAKKSIGNIR